MRRLAIALLTAGCFLAAVGDVSGEPLEIAPILTTPAAPRYVAAALDLLGNAREEILAVLSDCRRYPGDSAVNALTDALAAAAARGVEVRVILDRGETVPPETESAFTYLTSHGVRARWDDPEVTLHAKLLVVDHEATLIGSSPWTYNGLFRSVQADLEIRSPRVATVFREFFALLWEGEIRAEAEIGAVEAPGLVPVVDFPEEGLHTRDTALNMLGRARETIFLAMYKLGYYPRYPESPSNALLEALAAAARRGVRVRVLLEGGEDFPDPGAASRAREAATYLLLHGVEVRFDPPGTTLHAKLLIVDGTDLFISSANWSYYSLAKNVEAGIALQGVPGLGEFASSFFRALWEEARRLP